MKNHHYHSVKDFLYDISDVLAVLAITGAAAAVIIWRVSAIMNYTV